MKDNPTEKLIKVPAGDFYMEGELVLPKNAVSVVVFSHGSGSSRFSVRNNYVAKELQKRGIGTFLFDLLTREEDQIYENRFNIGLLTERLILATKYLITLQELSGFNFGYFGASTGSASAIRAAVELPESIKAVVSRGGRPDLAMQAAVKLKAPTLLIVGGLDYDVLELNREVYKIMKCDKKIEIVAGATHLFEEPGTLQKVALLAGEWFRIHLSGDQ